MQDDDANGEEEEEEEEEEEHDEEEEEEEEEINVSQVEVSAQRAIAIAENETNGTVVGLELVTVAVNETAGENETLVWEVELLQNGTEREGLVDATDGTVLGIHTEGAEREDADDAEEAEQGNETGTENGRGRHSSRRIACGSPSSPHGR